MKPRKGKKVSKLELLGVTAMLYPSGTPMNREIVEVVDDRRFWYCAAGKNLKDSAVVEQGVIQSDITVFEFSYPAALCYADELWQDFTFLEYGNSDVLEYVLEELATIAGALLGRQKGKRRARSVRFLTAWETVTTEAGWVGCEYYQDAETEAYLIGWANITLEGMTIVPVEVLIEEARKASLSDNIPTDKQQGDIPF
jgi:hypothetical protein